MYLMNAKNIIIGLGSILGLFLVLFFAYKLTNTPPIDDKAIEAALKIKPTDHVKWNAKSQNVLVEYSDFQCPSCRSFYNFIKEVEKTATPNAAFVFRNFPLAQIHPNAYVAAYAAEAAAIQGKFWEMEGALYEKQTEWSGLVNPRDYFLKLAIDLKLDVDKFESDLDSSAVTTKVQADLTEGEAIGVNSTPSLYLNGKKVQVNTFEEFKELLLSL